MFTVTLARTAAGPDGALTCLPRNWSPVTAGYSPMAARPRDIRLHGCRLGSDECSGCPYRDALRDQAGAHLIDRALVALILELMGSTVSCQPVRY